MLLCKTRSLQCSWCSDWLIGMAGWNATFFSKSDFTLSSPYRLTSFMCKQAPGALLYLTWLAGDSCVAAGTCEKCLSYTIQLEIAAWSICHLLSSCCRHMSTATCYEALNHCYVFQTKQRNVDVPALHKSYTALWMNSRKVGYELAEKSSISLKWVNAYLNIVLHHLCSVLCVPFVLACQLCFSCGRLWGAVADRHPSFSCPVTSTEEGEAERGREGERGIFPLFKLVINKHLQAINPLTVSAFFGGELHVWPAKPWTRALQTFFFSLDTEYNDHL